MKAQKFISENDISYACKLFIGMIFQIHMNLVLVLIFWIKNTIIYFIEMIKVDHYKIKYLPLKFAKYLLNTLSSIVPTTSIILKGASIYILPIIYE